MTYLHFIYHFNIYNEFPVRLHATSTCISERLFLKPKFLNFEEKHPCRKNTESDMGNENYLFRTLSLGSLTARDRNLTSSKCHYLLCRTSHCNRALDNVISLQCKNEKKKHCLLHFLIKR